MEEYRFVKNVLCKLELKRGEERGWNGYEEEYSLIGVEK